MIERLVPQSVAVAEQFGPPSEADLFPDEATRIARAVAKRRREFSSVRGCARQAMAQLGVAATAILPGERGAPGWPSGVVGSMTHCEGYRAAALARSETALGIGIDAEPHGRLPDGVLRVVSRPEEREWLDRAPRGVHWDRLLFSAKESTYKAWYPLTGQWLGFDDAHISIDPAGAFTVTFLVTPPRLAGRTITEFPGRWLVSQGLVVTAIVLNAAPAPPDRR